MQVFPLFLPFELLSGTQSAEEDPEQEEQQQEEQEEAEAEAEEEKGAANL